jgi:hypothetical protein
MGPRGAGDIWRPNARRHYQRCASDGPSQRRRALPGRQHTLNILHYPDVYALTKFTTPKTEFPATALCHPRPGCQMGQSWPRIHQQRLPRVLCRCQLGRRRLVALSAPDAPRAPHGPAHQDGTHRLRPVDLVRRLDGRLEEAARGDVVLLGRRGQGGARRRVCESTCEFWNECV